MAMLLLKKIRRQTAVYWAPSGSYDKHGQKAFSAGVELQVRWQSVTGDEQSETEERTRVMAKVFVGQDVEKGGVFMLGSLDSDVDDENPLSNDGAYVIRDFKYIPTLKNDDVLRMAIL